MLRNDSFVFFGGEGDSIVDVFLNYDSHRSMNISFKIE